MDQVLSRVRLGWVAAVAVVLSAGTASTAGAAFYVQRSNPSDREVREVGTLAANTINSSTAGVGFNADPAGQEGRRFVMLIPLPTLAANESISNANFDIRLFNTTSASPGDDANDPDHAVNLVALGTRMVPGGLSANTVAGSDYSASSTLLSPSIIPVNPPNIPGPYTVAGAPGGNAALLAYVQNIYAMAGAGFDPQDGDLDGIDERIFLLLRLDQSIDEGPSPAGGKRYSIVTGDGATVVDRPTLFLTTVVPEPASLGLLGIGGLFALRRRSR